MKMTMFLWFLAFSMSFSNLALASKEDCNIVSKSRLELSVHASNWANAISTRTPSGGPYKYKELSCEHAGACKIIERARYKTVYEPGHPDADRRGYVKYPDIERQKELDVLSSHAQLIRYFGPRCEGTRVIDNPNSSLVAYPPGSGVEVDTFNFRADRKLINWSRTDSQGHTQVLNF